MRFQQPCKSREADLNDTGITGNTARTNYLLTIGMVHRIFIDEPKVIPDLEHL